jgi:hypothetical protein
MTYSNRTLSCPRVNHAHSAARFSVAVATIAAVVVLPAVPAQASTLDACAHGCAYTALAPASLLPIPVTPCMWVPMSTPVESRST